MKQVYTIDTNFVDTRLDRWFKKNIDLVPQSFIEKNLRKGNIKVNDKKVKNSYKLQLNDKIILYNIKLTKKKQFYKKEYYKPTKKELTYSSDLFIYSDENFVVLNKPADISVQSGTKSKRNILDILRKTKEFEGTIPYSVHRIDKETTGILIVAKNRKYAQLFTTLFRIRKINKTYLCIAVGQFQNSSGTLRHNLIQYKGVKKTTVKAITHYEVIDSNNNYSLLKLNPETGRKHQLRKQLLIHGYPVLGDNKYRISDIKAKSQLMLHAYKINFSINASKYNFLAEPPIAFTKMLNEKYLRIY